MKPEVMAGLVALGLGLAVGSGVSAYRVVSAEAAADSAAVHAVEGEAAGDPEGADSPGPDGDTPEEAHADTPAPSGALRDPDAAEGAGATDVDGAQVDGGGAGAEPPVPAAPGPTPEVGGPVHRAAPGTATTPSPLPGGRPSPAGAADAEPSGAERLAQVFGAMKPRDAAPVLEGLTDPELQAILRHLSNRKVASIVALFPPERAARLSRTLLQPSEEEDRNAAAGPDAPGPASTGPADAVDPDGPAVGSANAASHVETPAPSPAPAREEPEAVPALPDPDAIPRPRDIPTPPLAPPSAAVPDSAARAGSRNAQPPGSSRDGDAE